MTVDKTDTILKIELDQEEKYEIKSLIRILRMMQLFCEGHNNNMQNYLRV